MTFHWLLTGAAVVLAGAAFAKARRLAKRLDRLNETYWDLRYEHGQLRARVNRLDPEKPPPEPEAAAPGGGTTFVPLSSLKR